MLVRIWLAMVLAMIALPCAAQTKSVSASAPPPAPVQVAFETSEGRFVVEVDREHAPVTAANFLRYVDAKRLDGIRFYRVVKVEDHFGFVQFGLENNPKRVFAPIKHEPTTLTGLKHLDGTISMPRLEPGSAQAEFTISVGDQPSFDANPDAPGDNLGYAAFGHVVEGMDVVLRIFDAPVSPDATLLGGAFKGEVPVAPVKVISARRVP